MKKILLIMIINCIIISACSNSTDYCIQNNLESSTKIKKDQAEDKYDIISKHLNSKEIKYICHISGDKNTIYYTTQNNQLVYAEVNNGNINIKKTYNKELLNKMILTKNVFVNEIENILYCSSNNADGSQSLFSMDMETGQIENLLNGIDIFSEYTPNYYFNYHNGVLLFQLRKKNNKDDRYAKYWGLIDTNNDQARLLDVEEILGTHLVKGYKDMFVIGDNKIMIVVHNGDMINLFYTDFTGKIIKTVKNIDKITSQMQSGLSACHVSPDGKYLFFSWQQTPITLTLYDIKSNTEYKIIDGTNEQIRTFSGWLNNNTFIYQVLNLETKERKIEIVKVDKLISSNG